MKGIKLSFLNVCYEAAYLIPQFAEFNKLEVGAAEHLHAQSMGHLCRYSLCH